MSCSEWTGQQLAECSLYGVRVYKEGAVLATHVDRKFITCSSFASCLIKLLRASDTDNRFPL
jgi:prolyl 4-hydroxylase